MELSAFFALENPIGFNFGAATKIAQVVLQDGIAGTAEIDFAVRADDGTIHHAIFDVQFGGGTAVPEPSSLAVFLALSGAIVVARRRRRHLLC